MDIKFLIQKVSYHHMGINYLCQFIDYIDMFSLLI
jgi:hypothetical protein